MAPRTLQQLRRAEVVVLPPNRKSNRQTYWKSSFRQRWPKLRNSAYGKFLLDGTPYTDSRCLHCLSAEGRRSAVLYGSTRRLMGLPMALALGATLVSAQGYPRLSVGDKKPHEKKKWLVRPCTRSETALWSASEASSLFAGEPPTFNWCEAMDTPWLPRANVLRFHTAVHIDYSYTGTVIKATPESPVRLIGSGEGMVSRPSPNLPGSLVAMNDLLTAARPSLTNSRLKSAGILYLFLLGSEKRNQHSFFSRPECEHPLLSNDYRESYRKKGILRVVKLTTRNSQWTLTFSMHQGRLHLDSVVDDMGT